jgi:hypothetical protein
MSAGTEPVRDDGRAHPVVDAEVVGSVETARIPAQANPAQTNAAQTNPASSSIELMDDEEIDLLDDLDDFDDFDAREGR